MEFDELKKIWDAQNNQPMYAINEETLHKRVISKKRTASKIANWMEVILIGANLLAGSMLLFAVIFKGKSNETFIYLMIGLMLITPFYLLYQRSQRKKVGNKFALTMLGDLEHALSNATYSETLSRTSQIYFGLIAILTVLSMVIDKGSSLLAVMVISLFFIFTLFASTWEHKIYVRKKRELEALNQKLKEDFQE
jgi:hypothetical protein